MEEKASGGGVEIQKVPLTFKSAVWSKFGFKVAVKDGVKTTDKTAVVCKICKIELVYRTGTTNLRNHLRRKHPHVKLETKSEIASSHTDSSPSCAPPPLKKKKSQPLLSDIVHGNKIPSFSNRAKDITRRIGIFMALDMRPFSVVLNEGFRNLIAGLEPKYDIPSHTHFAEHVIPNLYDEVKEKVLQSVSSASSVALTTDSWTSRSTESYVTITAHLIDDSFKVDNYVLQTRHLPVSHTAENLSSVLKSAVIEWGLEKHGNQPNITTDNAINIVNAVKLSEMTHVRCIAHTLNLVTQKGLKVPEIICLLKKVRRLVAFFHRSSTATSKLEQTQKGLNLPTHRLIQDVETRWNSTYDMLMRYIEQKAAVSATLLMKELHFKEKDVALSDSDLSTVEEIVKVLCPFKIATTALCSEKYPTVSMIYNVKEKLLLHLQPCASDSDIIRSMKMAMAADLNSRYNDPATVQFLLESSAMDPRFKSLPYATETQTEAVYTALTAKMHYLLGNTQVKQEPSATTTSDAGPPLPDLPQMPDVPEVRDDNNNKHESSDADEDVKVTSTKSLSALDDLFGDVFITHVDTSKKFDRVTAEIDSYRLEPAVNVNENPLMWWNDRKDKFPLLAQIAKSYLVTQATSVASERVFSTAGDVVNAQRACLTGRHIDQLIFLKKNLKLQ